MPYAPFRAAAHQQIRDHRDKEEDQQGSEKPIRYFGNAHTSEAASGVPPFRNR
jgi:hypothetical protein